MKKKHLKNMKYVIIVAILLLIAYYSRAFHTEVSSPIV